MGYTYFSYYKPCGIRLYYTVLQPPKVPYIQSCITLYYKLCGIHLYSTVLRGGGHCIYPSRLLFIVRLRRMVNGTLSFSGGPGDVCRRLLWVCDSQTS